MFKICVSGGHSKIPSEFLKLQLNMDYSVKKGHHLISFRNLHIKWKDVSMWKIPELIVVKNMQLFYYDESLLLNYHSYKLIFFNF